ncbi:MAG: TIGR00296 family protein [Candidatus Micrarchaeia archaeon]
MDGDGRLPNDEGIMLTQEARRAANAHICGLPKKFLLDSKKFSQQLGIFVTISKYPSNELRGCIGFIDSPLPLFQSVVEASIAASSQDPRFEPISASELSSCVFEVSVLTMPSLLRGSVEQKIKSIKIGRDGLILQYGSACGLLLPQVATEWNFSPKEFLEALCEKAGLPKDMYKSASAKIYSFEAQIFCESSPNGKIERKKLIV